MTAAQHLHPTSRPIALVTGGSAGLGLALVHRLAAGGRHVVTDARDADRLRSATAALADAVTAVPGDVTDPAHRAALVAAAAALPGPLDLVVLSASALGPTPLPRLTALGARDLAAVLDTNVVAPVALLGALRPRLGPGATVVLVSSDAAVEAYPGWGGYGASKAALDRVAAVLAVEEPDLTVLAVDPGDMATAMHAAADPDADPADLADPADVADRLVALVEGRPASGRYRLADLTAEVGR